MLLSYFAFAVSVGVVVAQPHPLSDEFIESINDAQSSWKAGRNFHPSTPISQIKSYLGARRSNSNFEIPNLVAPEIENLPDNFDAREHWPNCLTIGRIRDQGPCGSCWGIAAVEAMSDRICIKSNQTLNVALSTRHLISCCATCGMGCNGGYPSSAWHYWVHTGIVTGGEHDSKQGCQTYPFARCEHHTTGRYPPCGSSEPTPKCLKKCDDGSGLTFQSELHYGEKAYRVAGKDVNIRSEIFANGPIEADFDVFEDFLSYKTGVYHYVKGGFLGGHAVKILGWGVENDTPYWLVVNSWNEDWGDRGFFKIRRNTDECGIEDDLIAGTPKL